MKKIFLLAFLSIVIVTTSFAHAMWIETSPVGDVGNSQEVKVYFGEYAYGAYEEVGGDSFNKMKAFQLYAVDAMGNKVELTTRPEDIYYVAKFIPEKEGVYTIVLDNDNIDVMDYTDYDFGIFKTHYHSTATVVVGKSDGSSKHMNTSGLSISQHPTINGVKLRVEYLGKPLVDAEVEVMMIDGWGKSIKTDENGIIRFSTPFDTKYVVEVTKKEEVPGKHNGEKYEFIWHASTYVVSK